MKRRATILGLILLVAVTPAVTWAADDSPKAWFRDYRRSMDALTGEACRDELPSAMTLAESPNFNVAASLDGQLEFLWKMLQCAINAREFEIAFKVGELWYPRDPENLWPNLTRMHFGVFFDQPLISLDSLQVVAAQAPEKIREMDPSLVYRLRRAADAADQQGERSFALHEALMHAGYQPAAPENDDGLRLTYGRFLLLRGRLDEARERLSTITHIRAMVAMRVEHAFAPLRADPEFQARLDPETIIERDIARSQATMAANPALLEAVQTHIDKLQAADRHADALALADQTLARLAEDPDAYSDAESQRRWLHDARGSVLYELGRSEEGNAAMREAAGPDASGKPDVNNLLNLAVALIADGRGREAMELLPDAGETSPFGRGWVEVVRTCAGVQISDDQLRTEGLAYLKEHESDNVAALMHGLLCANDIDGAAALMIRRLGRAGDRANALLALQLTSAPSKDERKFRRLLLERFESVRARPDVREAAEAVGRIETLPFDVGGDI